RAQHAKEAEKHDRPETQCVEVADGGHDGTIKLLTHLDLTGLRVIRADLRGHGASDQATIGFTTERFAQDMFAVADDAAAETIVLVGYSRSGHWAQWMACT